MLQSNIISNINRTIKSSVAVIGSGGYDAAAQDYFTRAEALGGDFDRTAINAAYTPAHVKAAINAFVAGCKTDLIWTKLTEVYLMAGVSFGGLMAKLKYSSVATLTNTNFVSGDYVGAGSGAGLKGNGSNKYLNTSQAASGSVASINLSAYLTHSGTVSSKAVFEAASGGTANIVGIDNTGSTGTFGGYAGSIATKASSGQAWANPTGAGYTALNAKTATDLQMFKNGVASGTKITTDRTALTITTNSLFLFSYNDNGPAGALNDCRIAFASQGTGLTDTDAANLSLRVNALMTALGANVY